MDSACNVKRIFVERGLRHAEVDELIKRELSEYGYSHCELLQLKDTLQVIIHLTKVQGLMSDDRIFLTELQIFMQKRFNLEKIEINVAQVKPRGLCAVAQCESLKYKLKGGLMARRACYGILRFIMESGAVGVEIVISGKLRGQRARSMKFCDGLMIHSGHHTKYYVSNAVQHISMKQGVLGMRIKIMLPYDPKEGVEIQRPDVVTIHDFKEEEHFEFPPKTNVYVESDKTDDKDQYNDIMAIYLIKRFLDYFFNRYLKRSNSSFTLYNDTKNKLLETIMERETYNKAKELIDKYTKKDENKSISLILLIRLLVILDETKQLVEPDVSNIEKSRETEKIELIRPILSRNRSIMERFLDFILGDGPQNRFALICQNCFSHNGMSLIEEADYLSYRCCYCNYPNNPKLRESRKPYQMHNVDSKNDFPSNINRSQSLPRI
ncbi:hypothetical protein A3Q56_01613 [Intoshia linei]|uniref:Small ribosomal subunit protein uS3 n=1 Tax=Intoshia linei TaxID=1819745 RepID=A0A177B8L5_9BILA|nr:hypothetical protein A3Q56_01613 [Intoshia linei]